MLGARSVDVYWGHWNYHHRVGSKNVWFPTRRVKWREVAVKLQDGGHMEGWGWIAGFVGAWVGFVKGEVMWVPGERDLGLVGQFERVKWNWGY